MSNLHSPQKLLFEKPIDYYQERGSHGDHQLNLTVGIIREHFPEGTRLFYSPTGRHSYNMIEEIVSQGSEYSAYDIYRDESICDNKVIPVTSGDVMICILHHRNRWLDDVSLNYYHQRNPFWLAHDFMHALHDVTFDPISNTYTIGAASAEIEDRAHLRAARFLLTRGMMWAIDIQDELAMLQDQFMERFGAESRALDKFNLYLSTL